MFNPYALLIAAVVIMAALSGAYVKGRIDGNKIATAQCLADMNELNGQIEKANKAIRETNEARRQAFDAVLEQRRANAEKLASVEAEAEAALQKRIDDYENELDGERSAARLKLSEYETEIAALADSCLLSGRDIDRMRRGQSAIE